MAISTNWGGFCFARVLVVGALVCAVYVRPPDFWKLPYQLSCPCSTDQAGASEVDHGKRPVPLGGTLTHCPQRTQRQKRLPGKRHASNEDW